MSFKSFIGARFLDELARVREQLADEKQLHRQLGRLAAADRVEVARLRGELAAAQLEIRSVNDRLDIAETLKEQAEQALTAERDDNRALRRSNSALLEQLAVREFGVIP